MNEATQLGQPTIFRSAGASPVEPTHLWAGAQAHMEPTRSNSFVNPRTGPFAAHTRLAPTASPAPFGAPQLAYSMTGSVAALTAYAPEYVSGPNDYYAVQGQDDTELAAFEPVLDDSPEQAPEPPAKKPFLLVGSLAAAFLAIAISMLAATVVISVTPAADQKPITSSSQPILTPLATRASAPPVVTPVAAPVPPPPAPPAPPAIAPAPRAPAIPRKAPSPNSTRVPVNHAPTPATQTPPPAEDRDAPPPHDRYTPDNPPLDERDAPPPHDRYTPDKPPLDERDAPPHRDRYTPQGPPADDFGGRGGGFPITRGCIPLLPC
jgi:hypothetical protein